MLEEVTDAQRTLAKELLDRNMCKVEYLDSEILLHFIIELHSKMHMASVEVKYAHTNIVSITKDGETVFSEEEHGTFSEEQTDRSCLSIGQIKEFCDEVDLKQIRHLIEPQIRCNMDIAYEGISGNYGLGIGRMIRSSYTDGVVTRMKAYAAAASEARMEGCDMPVIINSGSGNQGIASSVPVIIYAREKDFSNEKLYRALAFLHC